MISAEVRVRIPFHDVDVLMVAWHGHYFKYLELARTALMQRAGLDWPVLKERGVAMPVVNVNLDYRHAIRYDQEVVVRATVKDPLEAALDVSYEIHDADSGKVMARGTSRQVYVSLDSRKLLFTTPEFIEAGFRACLARAEGA